MANSWQDMFKLYQYGLCRLYHLRSLNKPRSLWKRKAASPSAAHLRKHDSFTHRKWPHFILVSVKNRAKFGTCVLCFLFVFCFFNTNRVRSLIKSDFLIYSCISRDGSLRVGGWGEMEGDSSPSPSPSRIEHIFPKFHTLMLYWQMFPTLFLFP